VNDSHPPFGLNQAGKLSMDFLLGVVNTVLVLAALGTLVYTRVLHKRPAITEGSERQRLAEALKRPLPSTATGLVQFEPFTVNIKALPVVSLPSEGTAAGRTHFARVAMTLEIRDAQKKPKVEDSRAKIMDELLTMMGAKQFSDITTVQGRYILRNEILEKINLLVDEPLVMNVFFTEFIVQ
jgi:flagellar basal body-associated protein FliL